LTSQRRLRIAGIAAGLVLLVIGYGAASLQMTRRGERPLTVAVIQDGAGRVSAAADPNRQAWDNYTRLTEDVIARLSSYEQDQTAVFGKPGLVVWPETVLRTELTSDPVYRPRVEELVSRTQVPLLLGALAPADDGKVQNAGFLFNLEPVKIRNFFFTDEVGPLQKYPKQTLVPFGEYIPLRNWIAHFEGWKTTGNFAAGERVGPLWLKEKAALALNICFESLWPGSYLDHVNLGAHLLVNLSDDSWFENENEAAQHLNAAIMRAVEMRRWLVRASASGISAIIDPKGTVVEALPLNSTGSLRRIVGLRSDVSLYAFMGNIVLGFALLNLFWYGMRIRSESYYAMKHRERMAQRELEAQRYRT